MYYTDKTRDQRKNYLLGLEKNNLGEHAQTAVGRTPSSLFGQATKGTSYGSAIENRSTGDEKAVKFPGTLKDDSEFQAESKNSIISKYLFITSLIHKWIQSAQHSYELYVRACRYAKEIKVGSNTLSAEHLTARINTHRTLNTLLTESLANYDRTYETILWAKRDWELCMGVYKIQVSRIRLKSLLSLSNGSCLIQSQEILQQLTETELVLYTLLHSNDRQVVNLGFNYLDINISGKLKPFNTMPTRLIQIIQRKAPNKHEITIQQIQTIITKDNQKIELDLCTIRTLKQKVAVLKSEPNRVNNSTIATYQDQIDSLLSSSHEITQDLFIVHSFFVQAFVEFVSSELDQTPSSNLPVDPIFANRLKELEASKSRDPLHIHQAQQLKNEFNTNDYHGTNEKGYE
jgi:hypothetical protein